MERFTETYNDMSDPETDTQSALIGVVIPNWNGAHLLEDCLISLRDQDYANYVVMVVDNGSKDDSCSLLAQAFPEVLVHQSDVNLGFTGACNLGAAMLFQRGAGYVLLLNNDTVAATNLLSTLIKVAESDPQIGAISPYIVFHDAPNKLWYGGGDVNLRTGLTRHIGYRQPALDGAAPAFETTWANGCAFLLSAAAYRSVGLLSPTYFASYEDVDLSLRIQRAGFRVQVATGTQVHHKVSSTWGSKGQYFYYMARNRLVFLREHGARGSWLVWTARMLFGSFIYALVRLLRFDLNGVRRRLFEFLGVAAFVIGQRGKAPALVYRFGSRTIHG